MANLDKLKALIEPVVEDHGFELVRGALIEKCCQPVQGLIEAHLKIRQRCLCLCHDLFGLQHLKLVAIADLHPLSRQGQRFATACDTAPGQGDAFLLETQIDIGRGNGRRHRQTRDIGRGPGRIADRGGLDARGALAAEQIDRPGGREGAPRAGADQTGFAAAAAGGGCSTQLRQRCAPNGFGVSFRRADCRDRSLDIEVAGKEQSLNCAMRKSQRDRSACEKSTSSKTWLLNATPSRFAKDRFDWRRVRCDTRAPARLTPIRRDSVMVTSSSTASVNRALLRSQLSSMQSVSLAPCARASGARQPWNLTASRQAPVRLVAAIWHFSNRQPAISRPDKSSPVRSQPRSCARLPLSASPASSLREVGPCNTMS